VSPLRASSINSVPPQLAQAIFFALKIEKRTRELKIRMERIIPTRTLFYSTRCPHCARLFQEHPDASALTPFDIDQTADFPDFLRVVPTVVIQEGNRTPELIEGTTRVFEYFADHPEGVKPYSFSSSNTTNKGFSFIDADRPVYSEQENYIYF